MFLILILKYHWRFDSLFLILSFIILYLDHRSVLWWEISWVLHKPGNNRFEKQEVVTWKPDVNVSEIIRSSVSVRPRIWISLIQWSSRSGVSQVGLIDLQRLVQKHQDSDHCSNKEQVSHSLIMVDWRFVRGQSNRVYGNWISFIQRSAPTEFTKETKTWIRACGVVSKPGLRTTLSL